MKLIATALFIVGSVIPASLGAQTNEARQTIKPVMIWQGPIHDLNRIMSRPALVEVPLSTPYYSGEAYVIDNTVDFATLWMILRPTERLPDIDFTRWAAVIVLNETRDLRLAQSKGQASLDFKPLHPWVRDHYTIGVFPRDEVLTLERR